MEPIAQKKEVSVEPNSDDVVIREIARLKCLIESDTTAPRRVRIKLLERLAVERASYEAWTNRYASYFKEPRNWMPDLAPMPSETRRSVTRDPQPPTAELPRVEVFADFGGFSHRISYPKGVNASNSPRDIASMIHESLYAYMEQWAREFHRNAWDDAMCGKHGTMLWVPFDIQGMSIARAIKQCVCDAARVFYLKPSEDPFACYDYARELLSHGAALSDEYSSPGHPREALPEEIGVPLLEPVPRRTPTSLKRGNESQ
jgi:hypothetical protein